MIKGFLATLGGLLAIAFVFLLVVVVGGVLSGKEDKVANKKQAAEVVTAYTQAINLMNEELRKTTSYNQRIRLHPGVEVLYRNWEKDREKCAKELPHEEVYKVDEMLMGLEQQTRPTN